MRGIRQEFSTMDDDALAEYERQNAFLPSEDDDDLASFFSSFKEETMIHVYRQPPGGAKKEFLVAMDPQLISEELIAKQFGGGEYILQAKGPKPGMRGSHYLGRRRVRISPEIKPVTAAVVESRPQGDTGGEVLARGMEAITRSATHLLDAARAGGGGNGSGDVMQMMMMMNQQSAKTTELMLAMMQANQQLVMQMMTAMAGTKSDPMEIAAKMAELMKTNSAPSSTLKDQLETMRVLVELKDMMGGGGEKETVPETLLRGLMPLLPKALGGISVVPPSQVAPNPGASAVGATLEAGSPVEVDVKQMIAPVVDQCVEWAKSDRDPGVYAQVLVDGLSSYPPVARAKVMELFSERRADGTYTAEEKLAAEFDGVRAYAKWFAEFFAEVRVALEITEVAEGEDGE